MRALPALLALLVVAASASAQMTQEEARENWLAKLNDLAWFLWIIAMVITHTPLTPNPIFRLVVDLLVLVLVTMPDYTPQGLALFGFTTAVLAIDAVQGARSKAFARRGSFRHPSFRRTRRLHP